jgi:hypothetical protein
MDQQVAYGKTPSGQLLYDLAFTDLSERYLARKHHLPIASIRTMRTSKEMRKLRVKIARDRQHGDY